MSSKFRSNLVRKKDVIIPLKGYSTSMMTLLYLVWRPGVQTRFTVPITTVCVCLFMCVSFFHTLLNFVLLRKTPLVFRPRVRPYFYQVENSLVPFLRTDPKTTPLLRPHSPIMYIPPTSQITNLQDDTGSFCRLPENTV